MKNYFIALLAIVILFSACKKEEGIEPENRIFGSGVYILNQGSFQASNASISYYDATINALYDDQFSLVNEVDLGDVAQSINVQDDVSYIVVNNSGLIYCIDNKYALVQGKISGLTSPRNILIIDENKAYVSDFYSTSITVVNPSTFEITGEIAVDRTTEEMVLIGSNAYIANWSAYSQNLKNDVILVVNTENDMLTDTIKVGIEPNSLVVDKDNNFWALCSGGFMNEENPSLWKISGSDGQVLKTYTFDVLESNPSALEINGEGNELYFLNNGVFKMSISAEQLPAMPFIDQDNARFFGYLGVDPVDSEVYIGDPKDYQSVGTVYRFTSSGEFMDENTVGVIPAAFGFNY